jgi:hypothetical protein
MSFLDHFAGGILRLKSALREQGLADEFVIELKDHEQGLRFWSQLQRSPEFRTFEHSNGTPHLVTDLSGRNWETVTLAGCTIRWPARQSLAQSWGGAPARKWGRSS